MNTFMNILFRFSCAAAVVTFLAQQNWFAAIWAGIALIQFERAELLRRG